MIKMKQTVGSVKAILATNKAEFGKGCGMKWLNVSHDMWSTKLMDGAMGSSVKVVRKDMHTLTMATGLTKNNKSHGAAQCAADLQDLFLKRYDLVLNDEIQSAGSDTANAARAVSTYLDADQEDCEMHIVSLVLGYAFGAKENYKTDKVVNEDQTITSIKRIVTPGGPFKKGMELIKNLKDLVNYFDASGARKDELQKVKVDFDLPILKLKNPGDTRVGSTVALFRSAIINHYAFTALDMQCTPENKFKKLWNSVKDNEDWKVTSAH